MLSPRSAAAGIILLSYHFPLYFTAPALTISAFYHSLTFTQ